MPSHLKENMKKLIPVLIIVTILALVGFKYYQHQNPEKFPEVVADSSKSTIAGTLASAVSSEPTVNIQNETPINGKLYGVIEVGASGFNSFVVNIDKDKNWELVDKQFGESLAYEGFATTSDVQMGLKSYLGNIFKKGVNGRNAHFVMSSGALKNPKTKLIADAIEKMGYVVNRVTAEQEGKYALKALLPKSYKDKGFVVDIGSGNTKVSWYEGDKLKTVEASGAKYYQIPKTDAAVSEEIKVAVLQVPPALRKNAFLIGGVPFQLAKEGKSENRYTALKNPDNYSGGDDVKLKSGLNIYRAIYDSAQADQYVFDWDANFTIGFLMTLN